MRGADALYGLSPKASVPTPDLLLAKSAQPQHCGVQGRPYQAVGTATYILALRFVICS